MHITTINIIIALFVVSALVIFVSEIVSGKKDENIRKRFFSAIFLGVIAISSVYFGKFVFAIFILLLALICIKEFLTLLGVYKNLPYRYSCFLATLAIVIAAYFEPLSSHARHPDKSWGVIESFLHHSQFHPFFAVIGPVIMLNLLIPVFMRSYQGVVMKEITSIFATLYFGWFLSHAILLRNLEHGLELTAMLLIIVAANDTCAFAFGKWLGKNKLAPEISPGKTWEGFLGGMFGAITASMIFKFLLPQFLVYEIVAAAVLISITAPCGDLIVSVMKRDMKQKDTGDLIPGHGGLLDRLDSIIFSTPNFFYYVLLIETLKTQLT